MPMSSRQVIMGRHAEGGSSAVGALVDLVSVRELRCDTEDVGGHLSGTRLLYLAAATAVPVLYAVGMRPRMLTWARHEKRP
jgi:hypothetical protein